MILAPGDHNIGQVSSMAGSLRFYMPGIHNLYVNYLFRYIAVSLFKTINPAICIIACHAYSHIFLVKEDLLTCMP